MTTITPTMAAWFAALALLIHVVLTALQSNTLNAILAKFSLPAIPAAAFPWIGVVLGIAAGIVSGVQQGQAFWLAAANTVVSVLTAAALGSTASAHATAKITMKKLAVAAPVVEAPVVAAPASPPPSPPKAV